MPTGARGYSDSPRITVNELLKDPLVIPALILDITQNEFVMDAVLRMGGAAPSGAVRYSESTPLYADDFPEIRPEFGEVPVVPTSIGVPRVVFSHERAMAIMVSDEMRRRQAIDPVTRQLLQVKNTMVYSWNTAFYSRRRRQLEHSDARGREPVGVSSGDHPQRHRAGRVPHRERQHRVARPG